MVTDLAGNFLDGNGNGIGENTSSDSFIFTFRTGNYTVIVPGPRLLEVIPEPGAVDVELDQEIIIKFDSPMNTGLYALDTGKTGAESSYSIVGILVSKFGSYTMNSRKTDSGCSKYDTTNP